MNKRLLKYVILESNVTIGKVLYKWVFYDNYDDIMCATNDIGCYRDMVKMIVYHFQVNIYNAMGELFIEA